MRLPAFLGRAWNAAWAYVTGVIDRVHGVISAAWNRVQDRFPPTRRLGQAWQRLQDGHGGQYAGAITYSSFLALFPLLLLAVAITGFVLHSNPGAQQKLLDGITSNIPGDFGQTIASSVRTFIANRTSVGLVGLLGVVLTGLGWVGNVRIAIEVMWGRPPNKRNFFVIKALNLFVLAGLGLGALVSIGLTVGSTALSDEVLRLFEWHGESTKVFVQILGIAGAVVGDLFIFHWLLARLPGVKVHRMVALKGAVLASVGFEILKVIGTYTIQRSAHSLTAGPFAGVVGVLIWMQLVARLTLFCAAWMAVLSDAPSTTDGAPPEEPTESRAESPGESAAERVMPQVEG